MLAALIEKSMNLGPEWTVVGAEFQSVEGAKDELHIYIERTKGQNVPCPECGRRCGVYDTREREWRHLDIWQFKTIVHCEVPRTDCPECGVKMMDVPWEGDSLHFTALFEAQALAMAMAGMTVKGMSEILGEHDTRLWRLLNSAVTKARESADYSGVECIGVDETACRRGHNYLTSFVDAPAKRVIFAVEGRDHTTVDDFIEDLKAHGGCPARIRVATCDLSPAFAKGFKERMPGASRVADRFHVMQLFSKAIDKVRASESRESAEKRELLKKTRYIWLRNEDGLSDRQLVRKHSLAKENLKTGRACAMKEAMQRIYACTARKDAEEGLGALISWIMHSNLPEMKTVAKTLKASKEEILNYFDFRFTNAILEGLNSIIQSAKRTARGFRNIEYFKTVIYLNLGKLHFPVLESCATH